MRRLRSHLVIAATTALWCGAAPGCAVKDHTPGTVCEVYEQALRREGGDAAQRSKKDRAECEARMAELREELEPEVYDEFAECILKTKSLEALRRRCDPLTMTPE